MRTWPALEVGRPADGDLFEAALVDCRATAVDAPDPSDALRVFFASDADRREAAAALRAQFPDLPILPIDVPDEDWVSRSQASLRAVHAGGIVVAPPWDRPAPDTGTPAGARPPVLIVILPSMGFGTGHHATTRLCLLALQQLALEGRRVLDVGTGSGVLAIAARRLGAASVVAIDTDADALDAARDNLDLNPDAAGVDLRVADIRSIEAGTFDVITANLTGALLQDAAGRLTNITAGGGALVLSGFMRAEEEAVLAAYAGLTPWARTEEDGWVCVTLRRP